MQTSNLIEEKLQKALTPDFLSVVDESSKHIHHKGRGEGGHYRIEITSKALSGLSLLEKHRKIYAVLSDLMPKQIHALSIKAR